MKPRVVIFALLAIFAILLVVGIKFGEIGDIYNKGRFL